MKTGSEAKAHVFALLFRDLKTPASSFNGIRMGQRDLLAFSKCHPQLSL
jgi:hypothetical protein